MGPAENVATCTVAPDSTIAAQVSPQAVESRDHPFEAITGLVYPALDVSIDVTGALERSTPAPP